MLAESYLFYSSMTLLAMACLTLVLSILLRRQHRRMNSLPKNLTVSIYDKTFNVFNPYPKRRKLIHELGFTSIKHTLFFEWLPAVTFLICVAFILFMQRIVESGLLLSLFVLFFCLNLMLTEIVSEAYKSAEIFIKAVQDKASLGAGDIKVSQILKQSLPKLSNYYLVLSVLFMTFAATLGYFWHSLLWFFARVIGVFWEVSSLAGDARFQVVVILFFLLVVIIQVFASKIKRKVLSHIVELSTLED